LLALYGIIFGYLVFFANINLPHDYYQLILMPFLAILVAWTGWKVLDEINVPALKMVLVSVFICSVVVVSSVTSLTMMENSKSIPVFGAKVKPFLVGNRGLVIYGPLNNALELDHQFNDPAFLAAVDRIGLMRPVVSVDEALSDLQKIKAHFNDNYDEVVFYRLGTIDQVALKRFIQLGLALKHQEADLAVFTVKK
jgi:hypothetical protein